MADGKEVAEFPSDTFRLEPYLLYNINMGKQKYGYIYQVTNKINKKRYVGKRVASTFDNKYYGSGKLIKLAILRYGKESFDRKVLRWCYSKDRLEASEKEFIRKTNPEYNLTEGGTGGITLGFKGKSHTPEAKKIIGQKGLGRVPPNKGKKMSETTRKKIVKARAKQVITEQHRKHIADSLRAAYASGSRQPSMLGKKQSVESNAKRSRALKGIKKGPQTESHRQKTINALEYGKHIRWHINRSMTNENCRFCV